MFTISNKCPLSQRSVLYLKEVFAISKKCPLPQRSVRYLKEVSTISKGFPLFTYSAVPINIIGRVMVVMLTSSKVRLIVGSIHAPVKPTTI